MERKTKNKRKEKVSGELSLPSGVSASFIDKFLAIKGPKGEIKRYVKQHNVSIKIDPSKTLLLYRRQTTSIFR